MDKKEKALALVNENWPKIAEEAMMDFRNLIYISSEVEMVLRNMKIISGKWLQNYHWGDLALMELNVECFGEKYKFEASIGSNGDIEEEKTRRLLASSEGEQEAIGELLEKGGIRALLLALDGDNWTPSTEEECHFS